jgi:P2-related tail formation protein
MSVDDLLPTNKAPFEKALGAGMSDALPVPIVAVLNPATTPLHFLSWLAVHDGVRLWFSDWPEARRRKVIGEALVASWEVGVRVGAIRFLGYVDGALIDAIAYPARFVFHRARIGRTPIGHPPFLARYLVRVRTYKPPRAVVIRRSPLRSARLKTPSREARNRALAALRAAKAPETEYRVDFSHMRPLSIADAPMLDGSRHLGQFVNRTKL